MLALLGLSRLIDDAVELNRERLPGGLYAARHLAVLLLHDLALAIAVDRNGDRRAGVRGVHQDPVLRVVLEHVVDDAPVQRRLATRRIARDPDGVGLVL